MEKNINIGLLIIRLSIGILMLFHGVAKINGLEGLQGMLNNKGILAFIGYGVYLGEILAPFLLIIGYRIRLAALIISINMIIALLLVHSKDFFSLTPHGGWALELIGLFLFGSIALFFTGAGKIALSTKSQWD